MLRKRDMYISTKQHREHLHIGAKLLPARPGTLIQKRPDGPTPCGAMTESLQLAQCFKELEGAGSDVAPHYICGVIMSINRGSNIHMRAAVQRRHAHRIAPAHSSHRASCTHLTDGSAHQNVEGG